jgi:hypothetical protein
MTGDKNGENLLAPKESMSIANGQMKCVCGTRPFAGRQFFGRAIQALFCLSISSVYPYCDEA